MHVGQKAFDQNLVNLMPWSLRLLEFLTPPKGDNSGVADPKMCKEPTPLEADSRNRLSSSQGT